MSGARSATVLLLAIWVASHVHADGRTDSARPVVVVERRLYLMGTVATLITYAPTRQDGFARLERSVEVLEATEQELSTWRPDSALSRLNRAPIGHLTSLSPSLCRLLGELMFWHRATNGTFDPAIGALLDAWDVHQAGRRASTYELLVARHRSGLRRLAVDRAACTVVRHADVTIDSGGFGKGEALDRVRHRLELASPTLIDLGGQVMAYGPPPGQVGWPVGLAHPRRRDAIVAALTLRSGSLSTSGGSERDRVVDGQRIGHIIDPRSGLPVNGNWSVVVWHPRALVADILSTALYVMGPEEGLAWADERRVAACFLAYSSDGRGGAARLRPSRAFRERFGIRDARTLPRR